MGAGIALVAARAGHPVRLADVRPGAARAAVALLRRRLAALSARGRLPVDVAQEAATRLTAVDRTSDLDGCAVVVEAVAEDLAAKRALFTELEAVVGGDC